MAGRQSPLEHMEKLMFAGVYPQRRVLVTGHTGFKGSWLCCWLLSLGAKVAGFSLGIPTQPANFQILDLENRLEHFQGDIRHREVLQQAMTEFAPEMVFHLAAQALVRRSYAAPAETFETNTLGTMNVLECLRHQPSVRAAVIITSDKCYRNVEWTWGYRENDTLGGEDPYSASKAGAELVSYAYLKSYFETGRLQLATARAGNVIGGGDWAPDRLVPDCVRAWAAGQPVKIRSPQATRPWQHVLEPLSGYLWLGARLWQEESLVHGESFNFGPAPAVNQSVGELLAAISRYWPQTAWEPEVAESQARESQLLKLCCDKAMNFLNWHAVLSFEETIRLTAEWYQAYYEQGPEPMYGLTCGQIADYQSRAQAQGLAWAGS